MELTDFLFQEKDEKLSSNLQVFANYLHLTLKGQSKVKLIAEKIEDNTIRISPQTGQITEVNLNRFLQEGIERQIRFVSSSPKHLSVKIYGINYSVDYEPSK